VTQNDTVPSSPAASVSHSEPWLASSPNRNLQLGTEPFCGSEGYKDFHMDVSTDNLDFFNASYASLDEDTNKPRFREASVETDDLDYIGPSGTLSNNQNDTDSDRDSVNTDDLNLSGNKIYDSAKITVQEATILLYAYIFRHHLTKEATKDLMKVIQYFLPIGVKSLPRSLYMLQKNLDVDFEKAKKHYYCPTCQGSIQFNGQCQKCQFCNTICEQKVLETKDDYFYLLDMRPVLRYILEVPDNATEVSIIF